MVEDDGARPDAEPSSSVAIFYELARWRLDEQIGRIESLDRKLIGTFTLNAALIALLSAGFSFRSDPIPEPAWGLFFGIVAVFLLNVLCSFLAFRVRRWQILPQLDQLEVAASEYEYSVAQQWAALAMKKAYEINEGQLQEESALVTPSDDADHDATGLVAVAAAVIASPW